MNLIDKLKNCEYFVNNEYLEKYVRLVEMHKGKQSRKTLTNKHHILPRSWFKMTGREVDNSAQNLVTLAYREHVLAHYFLCLCTEKELQYANELALICLLSRNKMSDSNRQLVKQLPLYNSIYESYKKHRASNYKLYE